MKHLIFEIFTESVRPEEFEEAIGTMFLVLQTKGWAVLGGAV